MLGEFHGLGILTWPSRPVYIPGAAAGAGKVYHRFDLEATFQVDFIVNEQDWVAQPVTFRSPAHVLHQTGNTRASWVAQGLPFGIWAESVGDSGPILNIAAAHAWYNLSVTAIRDIGRRRGLDLRKKRLVWLFERIDCRRPAWHW